MMEGKNNLLKEKIRHAAFCTDELQLRAPGLFIAAAIVILADVIQEIYDDSQKR